MNRIDQRQAIYAAAPIEVRLRGSDLSLRSAGASAVALSGYACVTDTPYKVSDLLGEYDEVVARGSFGAAVGSDVRLLVNHDGIPIARTKSGTMRLAEDSTGLQVDAPDLDLRSPLVQTVQSAMDRGDLDQMSFAFRATAQEWNDDYSHRVIRGVELFDVSLVTYPANPATNAKLRSSSTFLTVVRAQAAQARGRQQLLLKGR
jgi:HK97 family phage prohead protease